MVADRSEDVALGERGGHLRFVRRLFEIAKALELAEASRAVKSTGPGIPL